MTLDQVLDRLMGLGARPWSEGAYGEAQMLLSRLRHLPASSRWPIPAQGNAEYRRGYRAALEAREPAPSSEKERAE